MTEREMEKLKKTLKYSDAQMELLNKELMSRVLKKFCKTEYSSAHWAKRYYH